jgi:hypothetical protein
MKKVLFSSFFLPSILFCIPLYAALENGMAAAVVVGQPDFNTISSGTSSTKLNTPEGVFTDGKKLFIVDRVNNRVLIYNQIPTQNSAPADVVLGQANFTAGGAATTQRGLSGPTTGCTDGVRLFIADRSNHRVLIWNNIPTTNNAPADIVLGEDLFTTAVAGVSQSDLNEPIGLATDGKRLFLVDSSNRRALIWNSFPVRNNQPADSVIGQPNFTTDSLGQSDRKIGVPTHISFDGKRLFIGDYQFGRILIYNTVPSENFAPADVVVGKPEFTSAASGLDAAILNNVVGVFSDGMRLYASDFFRGRVFIWDTIPTTNGEPASFVLGDTDFNTSANLDGARNLSIFVYGVYADGRRVYVADGDNHRILIFNIGAGANTNLGPHFNQGKAVLGKVFEDKDKDGSQDKDEKGIEGVRVASDIGIYAVTDENGKYHFPYIETGQHILKVDEGTLPEGAILTSENPRKIVVTKGILTKVSFGVKLAESLPVEAFQESGPLLKVSMWQEASTLNGQLSVTAELGKDNQEGKIIFRIECNYFLLIEKADLILFDENQKEWKRMTLPKPLPYLYPIDLKNFSTRERIYYQLEVYDSHGHIDRTSMGQLELPNPQSPS